MKRTFQFVADFDGEIPGAAAIDCGNYLLHDLPMARWESRKFLEEVLENIRPENLKYPERLIVITLLAKGLRCSILLFTP